MSATSKKFEALLEQNLPHMIDHVFLTKNLSLDCSKSRLEAMEKCMLVTICEVINEFKSTHVSETVKLFANMKQLYYADQFDPKALSTQITELEANQMLGVYIRKANCGMFLKRTESADDVIVATFQVNLTNEQVYGNVEGNEINHDIQVDYPSRATLVKMSDLIKSEVFAEQIGHFHELKRDKDEAKTKLDADTTNRKYVTQWLVGAVSNRDSVAPPDFPTISKKMRDEPGQGFRRSGLWIAIKVFLQLGLTIELGAQKGNCVYKAVMLRFMSNLAHIYKDAPEQVLNVDIAVEMLAKLARRVEKLNRIHVVNPSLVAELHAETTARIKDIRQHLDCHYARHVGQPNKLSTQKKLRFDEDVQQKLSNDFTEYMDQRKNTIYRELVKTEKDEPDEEMNEISAYDPLAAPDLLRLTALSNENDALRTFSHIENWVLEHLDRLAPNVSPVYLRDLAIEYLTKARDWYKDDPLGYSRMVLTVLQIIQTLDKKTCDTYQMFSSHRSGINTNMFDHLTLASRHHLEVLFDLQTYFHQRNSGARYPGLIEENAVTKKSFAVRFAKQDAAMNITKEELQAEDEKKAQQKLNEVKKARRKIAIDRQTVAKKKCSCASSKYCEKCSLQTRINDRRVTVYRSILMPEPHKLYALVFELRIPDVVACLRDLLYVFATAHYTRAVGVLTKCTRWTEHSDLSRFSTGCARFVFLGTDCNYLNKKGIRDDDFCEHPDAPDDRFIDRNTSDYNCLMCGHSTPRQSKMPTNTASQSVKKFVTFRVERSSIYQKLQWTLESTKHNQNKVLATQGECPTDLSVAEYVNFGSLRADGHRLQLRNLYRVLIDESLSFEAPSVLALVMQTLWQTGPASTWYRECNEDFVCLDFVRKMVDSLDAYIARQRENWKHPLKLLVAELIVCRMLEINSDPAMAIQLARVNLGFRLTAINWMQSIQTTVDRGDCNDQNRVDLYANLVDVAICGMFTFFVDCHHANFEAVFQPTGDYSAVDAWLRFIVTANYNHLLCDSSAQRESRTLLLRMAHSIGFNIESRMSALIVNQPAEVQKFVCFRYKGSEALPGRHVVRHLQHKRHTIVVDAKVQNDLLHFQIDYVFGEFLINGLPIGRLPAAITNHQLFRRMFGNTTFEVQPRNRTFTTVSSHRDLVYILRQDLLDGIAIIEQKVDANRCVNVDSAKFVKEMIPYNRLTGLVPHLLVEKYSHWYNREQDTIEFRPKSFTDADFTTADGIQYELSLERRELTHVKTQRRLLDVSSDSFKKIANLMSRLEHSNHIIVMMDTPFRARVELVRMKLAFFIDCTDSEHGYDVQSNEFSGMRGSLNQNIGTLFGLRFGLVLESTDGEAVKNRQLIVPHTKFNVQRTDHHVDVSLATPETELRSPPYFVYDIDTRLRTLKAKSSFAAWFYLAHLHAVTSYPLPDTFTGMTGVERALQILQLGLAWSSEPYDKEAMSTLQSLADLSPVRRFQTKHNKGKGHHQQLTQWPVHIHSHAAQDAFVLIVRKLIGDSVRLAPLFEPNQRKSKFKTQTMTSLNARSHARYVPYAPNCSISEEIVKLNNRVTRFIAAENDSDMCSVRALAAHYNSQEFRVPDEAIDELIFELFSSEKVLSGRTNDGEHDQEQIFIPSFCSSSSFANSWIDLYERIRRKQLSNEQLHLILTMFAFKGTDIRQLLILQAIAANPTEFEGCAAPDYDSYEDVKCFVPEEKAIGRAIDSAKFPVSKFIERVRSKCIEAEFAAKEKAVKRKYDRQIKLIKRKAFEAVQGKWPCERIDISANEFPSKMIYVDVRRASAEINALLATWYQNQLLHDFTERIARIFAPIRDRSSAPFIDQPEWPVRVSDAQQFIKFEIDFDAKMCEDFGKHSADIELARLIYVERADDERTLEECWEQFRQISIPAPAEHLVHAELYPRLVPTTVFPRLLQTKNDDQRNLIGALAVITCRAQRIARDARLQTTDAVEQEVTEEATPEAKQKMQEVDLIHGNWRPHEHPLWLLFEIDMDLNIRRLQVDITNRMIHPPGNKNSVMQLNMGEGKTSVIVPIVAAELANSKQLCTVNVLRHLFQTNLRSLRQSVGGLLGRRVYTMPCRRDMDIESLLEEVQSIFIECKTNRGILMTIPEHRLSFQLKIYDAARKNHFAKASELLDVHKWLNENSRHILDESDAILQPNYALIYSIGKQESPEGGALRWTCIQAILKRVPFHMKTLLHRSGQQYVEFNEDYTCDGVNLQNRPEIFTPCRLINAAIFDKSLKVRLINDILNGAFPELPRQICTKKQPQRKLIQDVLEDENLDAVTLKTFMDQCNNQPIQHTILILCGLLKFGVLKLALSKRWRVNYGCNPNGTRKMAVPFKAKDVAAEMTEFGHPDVAICLTQLSYYYSGLSDVELHETFSFLDRSEDPNRIYNEWISKVPEHLVPDSIKTYTGVNLADATQRLEQLFPILRRNMYAIDYWLSQVVFPREAKMFDEKITSTAWDLCTKHLAHPVTGFSGTNDTKELLPLTIDQRDLPELLATNENVRQTLLSTENDSYQNLAANISGMAILEKLHSEGITVLLDAGALMLELNNEQVALQWLNLSESHEAAIYFSDKDILQAIDRNGFITEFEYSAYRERLDRCLIYMDDVHTRGTDLKFPKNMRACVTLSGGITHDKTVQACMRMRMLGRGHSVSFWASHEAHIGIRESSKKPDGVRITTADVIKYIDANSEQYKKDFMSFWLSASLNYAQKVAAHDSFAVASAAASAAASDQPMKDVGREEEERQLTAHELLEQLRTRCSNAEKLKLDELYGAKVEIPLTSIARTAFVFIENEHDDNDDIIDWVRDKVGRPVEKKLKCHAKGVRKYTYSQFLDGECQKEMEYELEENREVYRPKTQKSLKPHFNKLLKRLFGRGHLSTFEQLETHKDIVPLPQALKNTKLYGEAGIEHNIDAWDDNLWATRDFISVIQLNADDKHDEFLRPVWWVVRVHAKEADPPYRDQFVLISPFECNELMPEFRRDDCGSTLHMFSAKLTESQSTLINEKALQIPSDSTAAPIPLSTSVQLSMFAGSMYFENAEEELEYCSFMGIIPSETTPEQAKTFKLILPTMKCGYIPAAKREFFPELWCRFKQNPGKIAMGIIEMRHGYARKRSHAAQIIIESKRFKWDNEMDTEQ